MKHALLPALGALALLAGACNRDGDGNHGAQTAAATKLDADFDQYKTRFLDTLWRYNPEWAASQGYHRYDSLLALPDAATRQREAQMLARREKELAGFKIGELSATNQIDYRLLENFVRSTRWYRDTLRAWQWDPSNYNLGAGVGDLLNGRHFKLERRLRNISGKIAGAPAYYAAAQQNVQTPTREHTQLAILQNQGGLAVFTGPLADSVRRSKLSAAEKQQLTQRIAAAQAAVRGYVGFLEKQVLPAAKFRSFRLGKTLFDQKFNYDIQSHFSADEIYQKAQQHRAELLRDMGHRAARLFPKYLPGEKAPADTLQLIKKVIDQLTLKHAPREGFVDAVKRQIPTLVKFVNDKKLLTQDPSKPLVVRETPLYMRGGGAGASVSAPGPYDTKADTYYNVEPLPADMPAAEAESYLREYNDYTLQILNIHEAIPGHYTQLVYANRSPSLIKSVFGNGAMIEGWAVYTERMMLENGYGNNTDEMWLLWDKWNMRTTLNTILDHEVHVNNIAEKDAVALLMRDGFQQQKEATNKWKRATLSQVQLSSYFTGYTEIMALREEIKKREGDKFNLKNFNEQFLSYGSAPVKYVRELMLGEKK